MKKATSKTTAKTPTPAPAKKAPAAPAKTVKKSAAPAVKPVKTTAAPSVAPAPVVSAPAVAPIPAPVVQAPPAVKVEAPAPVVTVIAAQIDIGFGNALYLRGEGPGLSWEKGVVLDNVAPDTWSATLGETSKPVVFKFLVNDLTWSTGEDYVATPGSKLVLTPAF